jgi:pimeloyl-ACP methyl ester carboxylesterase
MNRPVLNPLFVDDVEPRAPRTTLAGRLTDCAVAAVIGAGRLLTADLTGRSIELDVRSRIARMIQGIVYRLALLPLALALAIVGVVYYATHPRVTAVTADPGREGLFYEAVTFKSADGHAIDSWLVTPLDEQRVLTERDLLLRRKFPAVVLVHDHAANAQQMLPLIATLHQRGYVVLAITTRGCGSSGPGAKTFGLRESQDVAAAVDLLTQRSFVDTRHIAVVGTGTGGNAALLAASNTSAVRAVVLDRPVRTGREAMDRYLAPEPSWARPLAPLCRWVFEMTHGVELRDLDIAPILTSMRDTPHLLLDGGDAGPGTPGHIRSRQVADFLDHALAEPHAAR